MTIPTRSFLDWLSNKTKYNNKISLDRVTGLFASQNGNATLFCYTTKFYENGDLYNYLDRVNPDRNASISLCTQILQRVAELHKMGYASTDFKPANVLVDSNTRLVLSDLESFVPS